MRLGQSALLPFSELHKPWFVQRDGFCQMKLGASPVISGMVFGGIMPPYVPSALAQSYQRINAAGPAGGQIARQQGDCQQHGCRSRDADRIACTDAVQHPAQ